MKIFVVNVFLGNTLGIGLATPSLQIARGLVCGKQIDLVK